MIHVYTNRRGYDQDHELVTSIRGVRNWLSERTSFEISEDFQRFSAGISGFHGKFLDFSWDFEISGISREISGFLLGFRDFLFHARSRASGLKVTRTA